MAKKKTTQYDLEKVSFEQAIEDLTGIVDQIETGQVSLAESLGQYEKGMALIKHCRGILLDAEKRIEEIADDAPEDDAAIDAADDDDDDDDDDEEEAAGGGRADEDEALF